MEGFGLEDLAESEMSQPQQRPPLGTPMIPAPMQMPMGQLAASPSDKWQNILIGAAVASALMYFFFLRKK